MSLTKDDLDQIKEIVTEIVDGSARTIVNESILESQKYLEARILETRDELKTEIRALRSQESEDVVAAYEDIEKLKKRVTKIEQNFKLA